MPRDPTICAIVDPADPRVLGFRDLKDGARIRERGQFVAESRPVVARLVAECAPLVEAVLVTPGQWANLRRQVDPWPEAVPVYLAQRPVLEHVAGFPIHRGCVALARCPDLVAPALWTAGAGWWLGLEGISDHDNVGSLIRTAAVMGARGVLSDTTCADPLYRRSVRVSMGAAFLLPRATGSTRWLLSRCRDHGVRVAALTPRGETALQWGGDPFDGERWVLWVGAEGPGLSRAVVDAADLRLRIPMADGADSLNVAVAAGLVAWAFNARRSSKP